MLTEESKNGHRQRHLIGREQQDERNEEIAPNHYEHKDRNRRDPGAQEGNNDTTKRDHSAGAIDPGRLLEPHRDSSPERPHHENTHTQLSRSPAQRRTSDR